MRELQLSSWLVGVCLLVVLVFLPLGVAASRHRLLPWQSRGTGKAQ
jgi:hypothetical protein